MNMIARIAITAALTCSLTACQSVPEKADVEQARATIDQHEKESLEKLYAREPGAKAEIEGAVGHAVFRVKAVNAVLLVGQQGNGVLIEHGTGKRTYMLMLNAGTGPGVGYRQMAQIIAFKSQAAIDQFKLGDTAGFDLGVNGSLGTTTGAKSIDPLVEFWFVNEEGFAVQAYWGGTTYLVDPDLN
jgi:lipid-binding SYLF domain-containing protein